MKLLIIGHARHGKDTVCELLVDLLDMKFRSASDFANESIVYPVLQPIYGYTSLKECYQDRVNHRREWYNLIRAYNGDDPARLAREIVQENDIYCGMRHREEFEACRREGVFDHVIWVDASERLPHESSESMSLTIHDADIVIDNHTSLEDLKIQVMDMCQSDVLYDALKDLETKTKEEK